MTPPTEPAIEVEPAGQEQRQIEITLAHGLDGALEQRRRDAGAAVGGLGEHVADAGDLHGRALDAHGLAKHLQRADEAAVFTGYTAEIVAEGRVVGEVAREEVALEPAAQEVE